MDFDFLKMLRILRDVSRFPELSGIHLRSYQLAVARSIAASVIGNQGLTFVVIFPRQSGKNELQAQIETYLLGHLLTQQMLRSSRSSPPGSPNP